LSLKLAAQATVVTTYGRFTTLANPGKYTEKALSLNQLDVFSACTVWLNLVLETIHHHSIPKVDIQLQALSLQISALFTGTPIIIDHHTEPEAE